MLYVHITWTAGYGLFGTILNVHKQMVRCATVHLVSGTHSQYAFEFLLYKVNQFLLSSAASCLEKFYIKQHASQAHLYFIIIIMKLENL